MVQSHQGWLSVLISNELTPNREAGPKTDVASRQCRSLLQFEGAGNRAKHKSVVSPCFAIQAVTVVVHSLEAFVSQPVQRGGKSSQTDRLNQIGAPEH